MIFVHKIKKTTKNSKQREKMEHHNRHGEEATITFQRYFRHNIAFVFFLGCYTSNWFCPSTPLICSQFFLVKILKIETGEYLNLSSNLFFRNTCEQQLVSGLLLLSTHKRCACLHCDSNNWMVQTNPRTHSPPSPSGKKVGINHSRQKCQSVQKSRQQ